MSRSLRMTPDQLAEYLARGPATNKQRMIELPRSQGKRIQVSKDRLEAAREYLEQIKMVGLQTPIFEFRFHPTRKWAADFAWPDHKLLVEYEGGVFTGGRHTRGEGYENDCEKYNEAVLHGWRLLRFTHNMVRSGLALQQTERALAKEIE